MDNQIEINLLKNRITNLELQNIKIMSELKGLRQDMVRARVVPTTATGRQHSAKS